MRVVVCVTVPEEAPKMPSAGCVLSHFRHGRYRVLGFRYQYQAMCLSRLAKQHFLVLQGEGFSPEELSSYFTVSGGSSLMLAKDSSAVFS